MLQGEDNTKDIVVIWPDFDSEAKNVSLYITGLSNETVEIECPAPVKIGNNQKGEQKKIYLRKTLSIRYDIKGNPASTGRAALEYKNKSWVMR
jgi:hypothetical protein